MSVRAHPVFAKYAQSGEVALSTGLAPDSMVVTAFDSAQDRFDAADGPLAAYDFVPQVMVHVWPFRIVYLHPDAS